MGYESPFMSRRVQDQFGQMDFGGGPDSLTNWRQMARRQDAQSGMSGLDDLYGTLRESYANTPALSAYRQHLGNAPQAQDYRPGKWDRLAAGLAGISTGMKDAGAGVQLALKMNRSKYDTALSDYYNHAAPLKEAAGLEREGISDRVRSIIDAQKARQDYLDYQRLVNKDYNDWQIDAGNLSVNQGELDLKGREFTQDQYEFGQTNTRENKLADSLVGFRTNQTEIGRQNAGTAAAGQRSLAALRDHQIFQDNMGYGQRPPSASDIGTAEQDVMRETAGRYPSLIQYDPIQQTYMFTAPPEVGTPDYLDYQRIRSEVEARANARARTGQVTFSDYGAASGGGPINFGGTYNPNPPPALPNFGPSQNQRRGGKYTRER